MRRLARRSLAKAGGVRWGTTIRALAFVIAIEALGGRAKLDGRDVLTLISC